MRKRLALLIASLFLVFGAAWAQAPVDSPEQAITGLLTRIGGDGAASKFEIVIDANLAENGKDVFVITSQNGKPCIKGNTQLSVATGINWYLNHYAHINLTWNNLTTDLSQVTLPVPGAEEKHVCNTTYRYNFNTCTFSYSMAFWTWERWQQEIDWMALHGINAPLNLVGLDVVTRKFLRELGVSENDINAYIAGPGFIAWFAMNNLEGWGGTINATDVTMNGNPDWWYTRQEQLCRNMLQRMRELGMQPVIPGFSGQVPNCIVNYSINGFSSGDVVNNGTWAGGYTRPDILKPNTTSYQTFATVYYKHLHEVMGVSELYSIDPFHEGSLPSGVTNATCYPNIMAELDKHFGNVEQSVKNTYKVTKSPSWMIQYWQGVPQSGAFTAMKNAGYTNRFIGLDLFADNIYADNAAKWRTNYYDTCPYVYCMLHNFGGRSGMHGRLETTMDGYFQALAKNNNMQGIGATPEGTETNPILYDMLFELPWMDPNNRPTADEWLAQYNQARYGTANEKTLDALKLLKKSVWDCKVNQQGTSEAVILARPNWTVNSVSSWSTSAIYWDTQDILEAADLLVAAEKSITSTDGIANYNYDVIDVIRQAMVDYAAELLPLVNAAKNDDAEYTRLYQLYLRLMLDLDEMLSYDENFKLERWTSLARNIANEVSGTTENDRRWLEWNARTQITVWSNGNTDLHDYSNRCWAGLIKDYHYKRWEKFFTTKGGSFNGGWYSGFEYPWTVDFTNYNYSIVTIPNDMTATQKAVETFGKYFGRVKGATKNYIFPMGIARKATKSDVIPEVYRGQTVDLPLVIGKDDVTITSVWVDLNNDGAKSNGETLTATNNQVAIPADAKIGKTTAQVVYSDGTDITFNLALVEDITENRTVTAVAGANGSVAIEGTNELSITNAEAVKMTATANTGYNFENWTKGGEVVSNDNPFIYYGKEAATFTANFIQDKWGVPTEDKSDWGDAKVKTSFVNALTFAYYNREPETIYEATVAPENLFNTIPQIINVPQGASFDVTWSDNSDNGLKYCYLSAYIDLNADGDFTDEGELLKVVGTKGAQNTTVCEGKINVILPYDAPLGLTHMRIRFDGAWKDNGYNATTKSYDAKAQLNRMCYEVVINITEKSDKAATVNVETNNANWGTVEVWTDETPDGSTGTTWTVSANIPMYLRATKANDDVEFLGWYDHYGRLLTENLEHTMYAREDATYTAKFQALDIDGWLFEYRTEPDTEITTKLANGVKPEAGKTYYIYAPTRPTNNGEYVNRYLYNNSGTLTLSTTESTAASYLWKCGIENGKYTFQNVADPTKYLKHKGLANAPYGFELGTGTTYYEGLTLKSVPGDGETRNLFFVINDDGSGFNQSTNTHNQSTDAYTTDFVFTEVYTPNVVILTDVRKSGNNDLVIPETVDILGEQCKIVGFDDGVFNNNKDLWLITMPKSMEFLSEKSLFNHTLTGTSNGATQTFAVDIKNNEGWTITMDVKRTGELTGWGSCLIASGNTPTKGDNDNYAEGFQFYLQAPNNKKENNKLIIKTKTQIYDSWYFDDIYQEASFKVIITYNGAQQLSVNVLKADGTNATNHNGTQEPIVFTDCTIQNITQLCTNVQAAITANVKIDKAPEANPFSGCSNLVKIAFDGTCANYYVDKNGDLYNSSNELVCSPEGKAAKDVASRELAELIEKMESLTAQVATYNPVGKASEIDMQATEPAQPYYIWCSNPHDSGNDAAGGVAALLDENDDSYLHTDYTNKSATNDFLQVELGSGNGLNKFKIAGKQRKGAEADFPKTIEIKGSIDENTWETIATVNNITQTAGAAWESQAITATMKYPYLKFVVTTGNNRIFFHMAKFDLFKLTSTATLHKHFVGTELTADFAAKKYDVLLEAIYAFDHATTVVEVQTALTNLQTAYTELENKIKDVISVKFTLDENNPVLHKIFIKREADKTVLKYDEASKMVAVENKADNSSWQAWYFMGDEDGVTIHPYNADGKKLGATNTGNGAGKVSAVDEATYDGWTFLKQSDGYFNLRASDGAYFSNFGGVANKMGFWNGDNDESKTQTDGGSLFKFEEVTFPENNPRFYQLSDVKAILTDGNGIPAGNTVGLYSNVQPYREACATASALIGAGNTSVSAECYDAYKALRSTKVAITYNEPDESKFYTIKSVSNKDYCKDKLVRTSYEPAVHDDSDVKYDHRHLVFDAANAIPQQSLAIFQFVKTGTTGEYLMKNLHTGLYVKNFAQNAEHMGTAADAQPVVISGYTDGAVTLKKKGDTDPMHAQDTHDVIVTYGVEPGNASTWVIEEADMSKVAYSTTISKYGLAGLYLNYPVKVPDDVNVTAYYVSMAEGAGGIAKLTKIEDGIIPANEGVILEGEPNATISLPYVSGNVDAISGNHLEGANYTSYIHGVQNTTYYLFGAKNGVPGLYWTYLQYDAEGTIIGDDKEPNKGGYFKCSANKVYLPYGGSAVAKFSFRFDDTTGIDDLLNGLNGEQLIYDLQGRHIMKVTESGIYIVNGQKRYIRAK